MELEQARTISDIVVHMPDGREESLMAIRPFEPISESQEPLNEAHPMPSFVDESVYIEMPKPDLFLSDNLSDMDGSILTLHLSILLPRKRHKKWRTQKKWIKRYGVVSEEVEAFQGTAHVKQDTISFNHLEVDTKTWEKLQYYQKLQKTRLV